MFDIGEMIKLKPEVIENFVKHNVRPSYFNDQGLMDYMFAGKPMMIVSKGGEYSGYQKIYVKASHSDYPEWMLIERDLERAIPDNRRVL